MQKIHIQIGLIVAFLVMWSTGSYAQDPNQIQFSAGSLKGETVNGVRFNVFRSGGGKRVILTKGTTKVFCDEARENALTKDVTAKGNIIIKDKGETTIKGDFLFLDKKKGEVMIEGKAGKKVKLEDKEMTLLTDILYYDMDTQNARYLTGGVVTQKTMVLTSLKGYLNNVTNLVSFKTNVVMDDTVKNQHLETDTLTYHTEKKIGYFHSRAKIRTKDGEVEADKGEFYTENNQVKLFGNAEARSNQGYRLNAEEIESIKDNDIMIAKKSVRLFSIKDRVTIFADEVTSIRSKASTKAYGSPIMQKPLGKGDTLFLAADTLLSITDTLKEETTLFAYYGVKIFSGQLKAKCDSLNYIYHDSIINFFQDPVLWSSDSQMTGQTIKAKLAGNVLDKLYLDTDAFILQKDSLGNYNQIKGRNVVANFVDDGTELDKVDVDGNGQTIYFAMNDDKSDIIGMNRIACAKMVMYFAEKNELRDMTFLVQPESQFIPPHELSEPDKRLPGFALRFDEAPDEAFVDGLRNRTMKLTPSKRVKNPQLLNSADSKRDRSKLDPEILKNMKEKKKKGGNN